MNNKLTDLNNYLFAQLERLDDESINEEELDKVIKRGGAIAGIAAQIIANGSLQLKAVSVAHEMGIQVKTPALLQLAGITEEQ